MKIAFIEPKPPFNAYFFLKKLPLLGNLFLGTMMKNAGHIGHLVAGLTAAGYLSYSAKEMVKGYEPPDITDPDHAHKILLASMLQGGGLGIYGDFMFAQTNRFGGSALTTLGGPMVGVIDDGIKAVSNLRDGLAGDEKAMDRSAKGAVNLFAGNLPGANFWATRAATDGLIMDAMKEGLSSGYIARKHRRKLEENGQDRLW